MLEIDWSHKLPGGPGAGHRMVQRWADTLFQPTQWYPRVSVYDDLRGWDSELYLGPSEFYNNFGTFDVSIDVPAGWIVSGTGVLQNPNEVLTPQARQRLSQALASNAVTTIVGPDEVGPGQATAAAGANGRLVWRFHADTVNDFAWATAKKFVWQATRATIPGKGIVPIHMLYLPGRANLFARAGDLSRHALEFYSALWFPYQFPQLTLQDGPSSGMEYPMVINSNQGAADHETGHQWWPMVVSNNETWYGWMDEGFNQYMNILSDADAAKRAPVLTGLGQAYGRTSGNEAEPPMMWNANYGGPGFYGFTTYQKTPLMLSMLGGMVGDSAVQRAHREWANAWLFKHPSPWDYMFFMNKALGRDLGWFWYYWLFTTESVDGRHRRREDVGHPHDRDGGPGWTDAVAGGAGSEVRGDRAGHPAHEERRDDRQHHRGGHLAGGGVVLREAHVHDRPGVRRAQDREDHARSGRTIPGPGPEGQRVERDPVKPRGLGWRAPLRLVMAASLTASGLPAQAARFRVEETTVAGVQAAFRARTLTCRSLVQQYLDRIAAYDKRGPAINALVTVNPAALTIADSLDARFARGGPVGPLHCIPIIVKDNFETTDLQTTAGSLALEGWRPPQDATMVRKIRDAGAIVLAKSNLAEWAFTPYETVSSILPGYTKNPYALDRVTAGSSGGTAAAVAANLGEVGLGSDTGNSIRGPSAHQALVGIRSTMGLTSRAGVVPLNAVADIAGPMARTVADAVAVFNVVVGSDPADTVTAPADAKREADYAVFLRRGSLKGARIGILRQAYERPTLDPEVTAVFARAVAALRAAGATIIDTARVDSLDAIQRRQQGACNRFRADLERYFAARGPNAPVKTLDEILRSRQLSSHGGAATARRGPGHRDAGDKRRVPEPRARALGPAHGRAATHGLVAARCHGLSHVEQSAAPHRRSQYAARRQQPAVLPDAPASRPSPCPWGTPGRNNCPRA